ncbi:MAG: SAM-dependent methyltransferase [Streptosporangiaceae bacterium]
MTQDPRPHNARVWNYWLGGTDNYPADRQAGDHVAGMFPGIVAVARANRAFLGRAVRYLTAEAGVRQFLDLGSGLPSAGATHEVAADAVPGGAGAGLRVVYMDNDPLVLAHSRGLLGGAAPGVARYLHGDLRDPGEIVRQAGTALDFGRPVGLLMLGVPASSERMVPSWASYRTAAQMRGVPASVVTCGCLKTSGSKTREPARCAFPKRVSPGSKRTFLR